MLTPVPSLLSILGWRGLPGFTSLGCWLSPWHYEITAFPLAKALHEFHTTKTKRLRLLLGWGRASFQTATTKVEEGWFFSWQWVLESQPHVLELSMPGSLGAWFESHYNPVMQVLLWEQTAMVILCCCCCDFISGFWYYSALAMQTHTSPLTPLHLHRIMAKIPDPAYKKPYKSQRAPFKSAALSYCKSGA